MATVVDDLVAGVKDVAALDPSALDDDVLHRTVLSLQHAESSLALVSAGFIAEWQARRVCRRDGSARAGDALARDAKRDPRSARRELRRAARLAEMAHTQAAVRDGRLGIDHVDLILRYATDHRWEYFLRDEEVLVEQMSAMRLWPDARRLLAYWAMRVDDEVGLPPPCAQPSTLYLARDEVSGEGDLQGRLGAVHTEIVDGELRRLMRQIALDDKAKGVARTAAERRAEALALMATRSMNATGATARPLFQVLVGADVFVGMCQTASGIVLHPSHLEPWCATAVVESMLFDGATRVVGVSRKRTFSGVTRRAVQIRDRHCQHASGCSVPFPECDVDHIVPWIVGGETAPWNGRVLCATHNRHPELRDQPLPFTPREYSEVEEQIHRQGACAAFFTDATAPPVAGG